MIEPGHFAQNQIFCQNKIIAWSHSSRFSTARRLLEEYNTSSSKILDYGCGDGTFFNYIRDLLTEAVGTDIVPNQIDDCRQRFLAIPEISFCLIEELDSQQYESYFDIAVCMEVLEHCLPHQSEKLIGTLKKLVKPSGIILISVPVEIGPTLVGKCLVRSFAAWLRQGNYAGTKTIEKHTFGELLKMVFATKSTVIERPTYSGNFYGHKGFNWRSLRHQLASELEIERTVFSPLGWLGGFFSSQVFLICRNK